MDINEWRLFAAVVFGLVGVILALIKSMQLKSAKAKIEALDRKLQIVDEKMSPVHEDIVGRNRFKKEIVDRNAQRVVRDSELSGRVKVTGFELKQFEIGDLPWKQLSERAVVIAIVSGKGGVGKSTIACALANSLANHKDVLLVDFDLPNRGLTARYRPGLASDQSNYMKWIGRFLESIADSPLDRTKLPSREQFVDIKNRFLYSNRGSEDPFIHHLEQLGSEFRTNLSFLPSRSVQQPLLASNESRLDVVEVATMIQIMARLSQERGFGRFMILDCHGGQDMFMAGAIVASDFLITVVKPEPGALESARELIAVSKKLVEGKAYTPIRSALVINECQIGTDQIVKAMRDALTDVGDDVFQVERDDGMALPDFDPIEVAVEGVKSLRDVVSRLTAISLELRNAKGDLHTPRGESQIPDRLAALVEVLLRDYVAGRFANRTRFLPVKGMPGALISAEAIREGRDEFRLLFVEPTMILSEEHQKYFEGVVPGAFAMKIDRPAVLLGNSVKSRGLIRSGDRAPATDSNARVAASGSP